MTAAGTLLIAGAIRCSGGMLALAGVAKTWRGDPDSAIRTVLRIRPACWRMVESAAGAVEFVTGAAVCLGAARLLAGSAMAVLGAGFAGLLVRVRQTGTPGGCGCLPWRRTADAVTWRSLTRAGCVLAAGVADVTMTLTGPWASGRAWFVTGALTAGLVYMLLSTDLLMRTPRCRRRWWFPAHDALAALTGNAVFTAFADSYGPLAAEPSHRRDGCIDQFSFTAASAQPARELLFDVSRGPGGSIAVRASVRAGSHGTAGRRGAAGGLSASARNRTQESGVEENVEPKMNQKNWRQRARANPTGFRRAVVLVAVASVVGCGTSSLPGAAGSSQSAVSAAPSMPAPSTPAPSTPAASSPSTSAPPGPVATCRTSQLQITLVHSGAAAGIVGGYIGFRNKTDVPCRLSGWPTLIGVQANGTTVRAKHLLSTMFGPYLKAPPEVTLDHGLAEAAFTGSENAGPCASGTLPTYRTLRVIPPGNVESTTITAWLGAVGTYFPACGEISVSPVVPSSALYNAQSS